MYRSLQATDTFRSMNLACRIGFPHLLCYRVNYVGVVNEMQLVEVCEAADA